MAQIDGFTDVRGDDVMRSDADGDSVMSGMVDELRNLPDIVRIQIPAAMPADTARRVLAKMTADIDSALRFRDDLAAGRLKRPF